MCTYVHMSTQMSFIHTYIIQSNVICIRKIKMNVNLSTVVIIDKQSIVNGILSISMGN